jgi:hypothetical protein
LTFQVAMRMPIDYPERSGSGTTNPEFVLQNSGFVVPDPDLSGL